MTPLRSRHWLAVILALGLVVVAYSIDAKVFLPPGNVDALSVDENFDGVDALAQSADQGASPDDLALTDGDSNPGSGDPEDQAGDDSDETDTEAGRPTGPVAPLTGLPTDRSAVDRSALVIKVDNHPRARPQTGLDKADIVFDLRAEGITRFAAVFQSEVPDPVGPVRSSRTSDFDLLRGLDTPLYGSSGGNDYVTNGLRSLPIVELTNRTRNEYFRDFSRPAPHNLYINGSDLYALAGDDLPSPAPWFEYRYGSERLPASARAAVGPISVAFTGSPVVTHEWDELVGGWRRSQDGRPHTTVDGDQLAPENVVIFVTDYSTSPADSISPEVRSTGSGPLVVLTDGHIIRGVWERPEAEDKPTLTDSDGEIIKLSPGRTWVLMPEQGQVSFADAQRLGPPASG